MATVPAPAFTVKYKGADITRYVTRLSYNDKAHGESDELTLTVEDTDGRWQNGWYPTKGDKLEATIRSMPCGVFEIDEITLSGPGDIISIKAIATGITKSMRTKKTVAHENKSLKDVAGYICYKNGYDLQGDFSDNPQFRRITQHRETDLAFIGRMANDYGYVVNVRENKVTFTNRKKLETSQAVLKLSKSEISTYSFTDKSHDTYKSASVSYHNAADKEIVNADSSAETLIDGVADVLNIFTKAENKQQAEIKAKAQLYKANSRNRTGRISCAGNERLVAGVNFELSGFGKFGGKYHIVSSTHDCDRSGGYTTSAEIKGVS